MALERAAMGGLEAKAQEEQDTKAKLRETVECPICGLLNCTSELLL